MLRPEPPAPTSDDFLGGALSLLQPPSGYRAGADAMLLAAAVEAASGERLLDAGAGVGAVALALARRLPGVTVDALEVQAELAALAAENARRNGLDGRVAVHRGDLARPPPEIAARAYDQAVSNPPYHDPALAPPSASPARALARSESLPLAAWLGLCLRRLRPGGRLTLIHRADRLAELLAALAPAAGGIVVFPLWPGRGRPAKRVIVRATKGARGPLTVAAGLRLHRADGRPTAAAEAVLRRGAPLPLAPPSA